MKKSMIIIAFLLALLQKGHFAFAIDDVTTSINDARITNVELQSSIENLGTDGDRDSKKVVLLLPVQDSEENEDTQEEQEGDDVEAEQLTHCNHKTKRCKSLNFARPVKRALNYPRKYVSAVTESTIDDIMENTDEQKSYFRLVPVQNAKHIIKSILKSKYAKREDNDAVLEGNSKFPTDESITLVGKTFKESDDAGPKNYVCYCMEENCDEKKPARNCRLHGMKKKLKPDNFLTSEHTVNVENQEGLSENVGSQQQFLRAEHNLNCPPGAVMVEQSQNAERLQRKPGQHHLHRRPIMKNKCPSCNLLGQSMGQPTRINIPLGANRKLNRRVYKIDKKSPLVQKLHSVINQNDNTDILPCPTTEMTLNSAQGIDDYYSNHQSNFNNPYHSIPLAPNLLIPGSGYAMYPDYFEYPQYNDGLINSQHIPLDPIHQPIVGLREPAYGQFAATPLGQNFINVEECIKLFGPKLCIVTTTTISSLDDSEDSANSDEELEEPTTQSQWIDRTYHTSTELPQKTMMQNWRYPMDSTEDSLTYYQESKETTEDDDEVSEETLEHSDDYSEPRLQQQPTNRISTPKFDFTTPRYFSVHSIKPSNDFTAHTSNHPSEMTTSAYNDVGSKHEKNMNDFQDYENFVNPKSVISHGDPNIEYLIPIAESHELEAQDDSANSAILNKNIFPDEISKEIATESPQLATIDTLHNSQGAHKMSRPYTEYTVHPTKEDGKLSSSKSTSDGAHDYMHPTDPSKSERPEYEDTMTLGKERTNGDDIARVNEGDTTSQLYYTTSSDYSGITNQQTTHGSVANDQKSPESLRESPHTVFVKMEEPQNNYMTTLQSGSQIGNRLKDSQRIPTIYPTIASTDRTLSSILRMHGTKNFNEVNVKSYPSNLHYYTQPEQMRNNVEEKITKPSISHGQFTPISHIASTPENVVVATPFDHNRQLTTAYATMENRAYTPSVFTANELKEPEFTTQSYQQLNNLKEMKPASSRTQDSEQNYAYRVESTPSTQYYTTQSATENTNVKSCLLARQKSYPHFDNLGKSIHRPESRYETLPYIPHLSSTIGKTSTDYSADSGESKEFVNMYNMKVPSTNFQLTTSNSDIFQKPVSNLPYIYPTTTERSFAINTQQATTDQKNFVSQWSTPGRNHFTEDITHHDTTIQPILKETMATNTFSPVAKFTKFNQGESRQAGKAPSRIFATPRTKMIDYEMENFSNVESDSGIKEDSNEYNHSYSSNDNMDDMPGINSHSAENGSEHLTDDTSLFSDESTMNKNDGNKDILSSTNTDRDFKKQAKSDVKDQKIVGNEIAKKKNTTADQNSFEENYSYVNYPNEFSSTETSIKLMNQHTPESHTGKSYESKNLTTNNYKMITPQSEDKTVGMSDREQIVTENPHKKIGHVFSDNHSPSEDYHHKTISELNRTTQQPNVVSNIPQLSKILKETRIHSPEITDAEDDLITLDNKLDENMHPLQDTPSPDILDKNFSTETDRMDEKISQPNKSMTIPKTDQYAPVNNPIEDTLHTMMTVNATKEDTTESMTDDNDLQRENKINISSESNGNSENHEESKNKQFVGSSHHLSSLKPVQHIKNASSQLLKHLLRSSTTERSEDKSDEHNDLGAIPTVTVPSPHTEEQTPPTDEETDNCEEIMSEDKLERHDKTVLRNAVKKVINDLLSANTKRHGKVLSNTQEIVGAPKDELLPNLLDLPILRNLFSLPEVKNMAVDTIKGLISDASGVPQDSSLSRLGNHVIESVLNSAINTLLPGENNTTSSPKSINIQDNEDGHLRAIPANSVPGEENVGLQPIDDIVNIIQKIIARPGIGLAGARIPAAQNIIVQTVLNLMKRAKTVVEHSRIWDTLNDVIARIEEGRISPHRNVFPTEAPQHDVPGTETSRDTFKIIPVIPVTEHVFKNGQWSEKQTVLGSDKKNLGSKLASHVGAASRANDHPFTSTASDNPKDYGFLGESEEHTGQMTTENHSTSIAETAANVPTESPHNIVGATPNDAKSISDPENDGDHLEKSPIKYYTPNDRILTYIKNHQASLGMTNADIKPATTVHSLEAYDSTENYWPSVEMDSNEPLTATEDSTEPAELAQQRDHIISSGLPEDSKSDLSENSKICKCMKEAENKANNLRSNSQGFTHEKTDLTDYTTQENYSEISSTIHHLDVDDGDENYESTSEEYTGNVYPSNTEKPQENHNENLKNVQPSEHSNTIDRMNLNKPEEHNDYSTAECIGEPNSLASDENKDHLIKIGKTCVPETKNIENNMNDEDDESSEESDNEQYLQQPHFFTTENYERDTEEDEPSIESMDSKTESSTVTPDGIGEFPTEEHFGHRNQIISTPQYVEPIGYEHQRLGMLHRDESTPQTQIKKITQIPMYDGLTQEATTTSHDLLAAAKSRDESEHFQENPYVPMVPSPNCGNPGNDPTYFGRISLNGVNPQGNRLSDLTNTDLFYVGDGVKIPLTIQRMPDGSFALSISEKICENFIKRKCPCCVPREGDIIEERKQLNEPVNDEINDEIPLNEESYDVASFEPTESSESQSKYKKRFARSTFGSDIIVTSATPVENFVKKYNLTLSLMKNNSSSRSWKKNNRINNFKRRNGRQTSGDKTILNLFSNNNQIQRDDDDSIAIKDTVDDDSKIVLPKTNLVKNYNFNYESGTNDFVERLLSINDVPVNNRAEIVLNALEGLINSDPVQKDLSSMERQSVIEALKAGSRNGNNWNEDGNYDLAEMESEMAKYGYQKDNPILDRIKYIKGKQNEHGQYKYQQNMDPYTRYKMNVLMTVLHWLREVFLQTETTNIKT